MITKTDRIFRRWTFRWERGSADRDKCTEWYRRETWWLLGFIPLYSRETVLDKSR